MKISASVKNKFNHHHVSVSTDGSVRHLEIASKSSGYGSAMNGAEFLLLAIATCFCNDIYREALKMQIPVSEVEVLVTGEFGEDGELGSNFQSKANLVSDAPVELIKELLEHTDRVAEIQNTLRKGVKISLIN